MASSRALAPLQQAERRGGLRVWANAVDLSLYRLIRSNAPGGTALERVRVFSKLGEHGAVWLGLGGVGMAVDSKRRKRWARATAVVGGAYLTSTTVKVAIGRRRPAIENLPALMKTPTGLSFPSSHSTSSFAAAQAFGDLLPQKLLYGLAVPMALSRLVLGVHYPSDIAAGALLGTLMGRVLR